MPEMKRLRLDRHHPDLVYVQEGPEPSDDDRRLGVFSTERDAAMVVGWGTFFWNSSRVSGHWERGEVDEAKDYWREKLARLDRMITEGAKSPFPGIRDAAELRRPERAHLAVLLRTLGMDIEELDEKEQRDA